MARVRQNAHVRARDKVRTRASRDTLAGSFPTLPIRYRAGAKDQFARDAPGLQQHASHGRWGADRVGYLFFQGTPDSPCDSAPCRLVCLRNVRPRRHASTATTMTASRNKFSSAVPESIGNLLSKYSNSCGIYFRLSTFQRELPLLHETPRSPACGTYTYSVRVFQISQSTTDRPSVRRRCHLNTVLPFM